MESAWRRRLSVGVACHRDCEASQAANELRVVLPVGSPANAARTGRRGKVGRVHGPRAGRHEFCGTSCGTELPPEQNMRDLQAISVTAATFRSLRSRSSNLVRRFLRRCSPDFAGDRGERLCSGVEAMSRGCLAVLLVLP